MELSTQSPAIINTIFIKKHLTGHEGVVPICEFLEVLKIFGYHSIQYGLNLILA